MARHHQWCVMHWCLTLQSTKRRLLAAALNGGSAKEVMAEAPGKLAKLPPGDESRRLLAAALKGCSAMEAMAEATAVGFGVTARVGLLARICGRCAAYGASRCYASISCLVLRGGQPRGHGAGRIGFRRPGSVFQAREMRHLKWDSFDTATFHRNMGVVAVAMTYPVRG